jgi:hypothetical protein
MLFSFIVFRRERLPMVKRLGTDFAAVIDSHQFAGSSARVVGQISFFVMVLKAWLPFSRANRGSKRCVKLARDSVEVRQSAHASLFR